MARALLHLVFKFNMTEFSQFFHSLHFRILLFILIFDIGKHVYTEVVWQHHHVAEYNIWHLDDFL